MLKFSGYSHFIWDLFLNNWLHEPCDSHSRIHTHKLLLKFLYKIKKAYHASYWNSHEGEIIHVTWVKTANNPRDLRGRVFISLKRLSRNNQDSQYPTFVLESTRSSCDRTDTQRGVLPGLSRECNLRSKIWWFTELCNSHYVSHFAAFFIVARTKISVAKSCS
jgi:hypothetical protein